jgi:ppGpp synthetase/RelA/SpoT-type nucleotidyltranferase
MPPYDDVLIWYNELAAEVQSLIHAFDWSSLLGPRTFEVTSRAKTIDTLRQKLQRDHSTPLSTIQDLGGVRFEAEMSLDEQDRVASQIAQIFGHDERSIHDLRINPHSGYRAVHIWLRLPARVEVQVRTHLQSNWANMYEAAADSIGRDIRYNAIPTDETMASVVKGLKRLSTEQVAEIEKLRNDAERLRSENTQQLGGLDTYHPDDTLPSSIAEAIEIAMEIDGLRQRAKDDEVKMQQTLSNLKRIFEN